MTFDVDRVLRLIDKRLEENGSACLDSTAEDIVADAIREELER